MFNYKRSYIVTICLWFLSQSNWLLAKDIHQLCRSNPIECLNQLPSSYQNTTASSVNWFQLKLYEIQNLCLLNKTETLQQVINQLDEVTNEAPLLFKVKIDILLAKAYQNQLKFDLSAKHIESAEVMLQQNKTRLTDPTFKLEHNKLAMLKHKIAGYSNQHNVNKQSISSVINELLSLEQDYQAINDASFYYDLYTTLGEALMMNTLYENATKAFGSALYWAKQSKHQPHTALAHLNLAEALLDMKQSADAVSNLEQASSTAFLSQDMSTYVMARLHLANLYLSNLNFEQTSRELQHVAHYNFNAKQRQLYNSLKNKLNIAK